MTSLREPLINDVIVNHIHSGMKALYKESLRLNANDPIIVFQESLRKIKDLSQMNLEDDYERFITRVIDEGNDESFIERMFDLTFRNIIKYYMEVEKGYIIEDIRDIPHSFLNMPKNNVRLMHLLTIESARGIWTKANFYCTKYSNEDLQQNYERAKVIIQNSVIKAIKQRLNMNEIFEYYSRPKTPEQDIKTDFYKFVTEDESNVPDRLDWQQQFEEPKKSEEPEEPEKPEEPDQEEDDEDLEDLGELDELDDLDELDELDELDDNDDSDRSIKSKSDVSEASEASEDPKETQEVTTHEPDVVEAPEAPKTLEVPEALQEPEASEAPEAPEALKPARKQNKKRATGKYVSKELLDADDINITLVDEKVDLSGIINK